MPVLATSLDETLIAQLAKYPWTREFYAQFVSDRTREWLVKQSKHVQTSGNHVLLPLSCLRLLDNCDTVADVSAICIPRLILSYETLQFCGFRELLCANMVLNWRSRYVGKTQIRHDTLAPDRTAEILSESSLQSHNKPILQGELVQQFRDLIVEELLAAQMQIEARSSVFHKSDCYVFFRNLGLGNDLCFALVARMIHRFRRYPRRAPSTDNLFELAQSMVLERFDFLNALESHFESFINYGYKEYDEAISRGIRHLIGDGMVRPLLEFHDADTGWRTQQLPLELEDILDPDLWVEAVSKQSGSLRDSPMPDAAPTC